MDKRGTVAQVCLVKAEEQRAMGTVLSFTRQQVNLLSPFLLVRRETLFHAVKWVQDLEPQSSEPQQREYFTDSKIFSKSDCLRPLTTSLAG